MFNEHLWAINLTRINQFLRCGVLIIYVVDDNFNWFAVESRKNQFDDIFCATSEPEVCQDYLFFCQKTLENILLTHIPASAYSDVHKISISIVNLLWPGLSCLVLSQTCSGSSLGFFRKV